MHYFHLKTRLIYNSKTRQFNRTTRDYKHMPGYKQMKDGIKKLKLFEKAGLTPEIQEKNNQE